MHYTKFECFYLKSSGIHNDDFIKNHLTEKTPSTIAFQVVGIFFFNFDILIFDVDIIRIAHAYVHVEGCRMRRQLGACYFRASDVTENSVC